MENKLDKIKELRKRREHLWQMGGEEAIERQHKRGKLTARERLEKLFDKGTFCELDLWARPIKTGFPIDERELPADAVVTGFGEINNRPVFALFHDFTVAGGTYGRTWHHKVTTLEEKALEARLPLIWVVDAGGERLHDLSGKKGRRPVAAGNDTVGGSSTIYSFPIQASGVIPQISLMLGPCIAGSAYPPTQADFLIMRKGTSFMSVADRRVLKVVTFRDVTEEELGGAVMHATVSGTADFLTETDEEAIEICRELLTYMPLNNEQSPPVIDTGDNPNRRDNRLLEIAPADPSKPYDMHEVIRCIVDNGQFCEIMKLYAKSMIIGFARLNGQTVGIIANNPAENEGILTINTCDKQTRFIRWCDCFNVPLIFLVDTPGFQSSVEEEQSKDGLIRCGAVRPVFAICEASVPMITVHVGKCFGPARLIMGTLRMGIDLAYSWTTAQVARMDPKEVVEIIYKDEINSSKNPDGVRREKLSELLRDYINYPYHAAEQLMVNDIIEPQDTRPVIIKALKILANKKPYPQPWRKHSLMPY